MHEADELLNQAEDILTAIYERGYCDQCSILTINGKLCHEQGCPTDARIKSLIAEAELIEEGI